MPPSRLEYDIAYGSYLFCALATSFAGALALLPLPPGWAPGLALVVGIPLFLAACLAAAGAMILSLRLRDDRSLLFLLVLTLVLIGLVVSEIGPSVIVNALFLLYGASGIVLSGRWFFFRRRR